MPITPVTPAGKRRLALSQRMARVWGNQIKRMWGAKINPIVELAEIESGGILLADKRNGRHVIWLNPIPEKEFMKRDKVPERLVSGTVSSNLAHEMGHVVVRDNAHGIFSDFLATVSELEYLKRHDSIVFKHFMRPRVIRVRQDPLEVEDESDIDIDFEPSHGFLHTKEKAKRKIDPEIPHAETNLIVRRLFRFFPQAKERNSVMRELIARKYSTIGKINFFLWQKFRKKKGRSLY